MGNMLVTKNSVKANKTVKGIQKEYLKAHRQIKARYPKGKLGKVVRLSSEEVLDLTGNKNENVKCHIHDIDEMSIQELWDKLEKAELRGLSGSGFPTLEKIETVRRSDAKKKFFIINAVACDPGLLHDAWLLRHYRNEIEKGIKVIERFIAFDKVIVASPDNVPSRYPMGEEKILIQTLLDIPLDKEDISARKGILVLNLQTVYAVYKAIYENEENKIRYITVANLDLGIGRIAKVRMGQSVEEIIKTLSGINSGMFRGQREKSWYVGMGAMEAELVSSKHQISAGTGFVAIGNAYQFDNSAKCKGCGACSRKCPKGIKVHKLIRAIDKNRLTREEQLQIEECIGCGTCSYYCKAGKNLMEILAEAKGRML